MSALLSHLGIIIVGLDDFPQIGEIEETGTTLLENSLIKARTVNKITGLPALADDSGLEVDALDGAPGVYSARYAGNNPSYEDNIRIMFSMTLIYSVHSVHSVHCVHCVHSVHILVKYYP